jgi:hypothetical protein
MNKPFSQSLKDENDTKARDAIINYYKLKNIIVYDNPDNFGIDLLTLDGRGIELEVHRGWTNGAHYNFVNLLERKKHLFEENNNNYFFVLNNDCSMALGISSKDIKPYLSNKIDLECWINGKCRIDIVYRIPLEAFKLITLN